MSVALLRCTPISCLPMVRFLRGERTPYWAGSTRVTHEMVAANHAANMSPPYGMEDSFNSIQNWHPSNLGFYRGVNCAADLSKKINLKIHSDDTIRDQQQTICYYSQTSLRRWVVFSPTFDHTASLVSLTVPGICLGFQTHLLLATVIFFPFIFFSVQLSQP